MCLNVKRKIAKTRVDHYGYVIRHKMWGDYYFSIYHRFMHKLGKVRAEDTCEVVVDVPQQTGPGFLHVFESYLDARYYLCFCGRSDSVQSILKVRIPKGSTIYKGYFAAKPAIATVEYEAIEEMCRQYGYEFIEKGDLRWI